MATRTAWLVRTACVVGLIGLGPLACGDDTKADGRGDSGGTGDAGGAGGKGGSSGSSGSGGSSGTGGATGSGGSGGTRGGARTKAECLQRQAWNTDVPMACLDCACEVQPLLTGECLGGCWSLLMCLGEHCGGTLEDFDCVNANCSAWLDEAALSDAMVMVVSLAVAQCEDDCGFGDTDAGTEDDGGS